MSDANEVIEAKAQLHDNANKRPSSSKVTRKSIKKTVKKSVKTPKSKVVNSNIKTVNKRKTTSPLQSDLTHPQKKNRADSKSICARRSEFDSESNFETDSESVISVASMASMEPNLSEADEPTAMAQMSDPVIMTDNPGDVHFLPMPMNPGDIIKIATELKPIMLPEVEGYVKSQQYDIRQDMARIVKETIADAVHDLNETTKRLNDTIKSLAAENASLRDENAKLKLSIQVLENRVAKSESANDDLEQYGRRNSLRIAGIREEPNESTDNLIMQLAQKLNAPLKIDEIDRSHRVGPPTKMKRDIIVKFVSYRARQKLFSLRKDLRGNPETNGIFFNEDLTKIRGQLLFEARRLKRDNKIKAAFSSDGKIFIYDINNTRHSIKNSTDLDPFRGNPM